MGVTEGRALQGPGGLGEKFSEVRRRGEGVRQAASQESGHGEVSGLLSCAKRRHQRIFRRTCSDRPRRRSGRAAPSTYLACSRLTRIPQVYWPALLANWKVWPLIQTINFRCVSCRPHIEVYTDLGAVQLHAAALPRALRLVLRRRLDDLPLHAAGLEQGRGSRRGAQLMAAAIDTLYPRAQSARVSRAGDGFVVSVMCRV